MRMSERGLLLVVSGPSGSGKTTVLTRLMQDRDDVFFSVSSTTRTPRPGERDGTDYNFVCAEKFEEELDAGHFLEWAEFAGNLYGTPAAPVLEAINLGKVVILDIEVRGALQVKEKYPDAVLIYLWTGSFEELERRLRRRGTEREEVLRRRLEIAMEEYKAIGEYKYKVLNYEVEEACRALNSIIVAERCLIK